MTESFHVYYPSNHNISPGIFVMAPPISWQQTYSLSLLLIFPVLAITINYTKKFPPSKLSRSGRQLYIFVFSPSESEKSRIGSKEQGSNSAIFVTVLSSVLVSQTITIQLRKSATYLMTYGEREQNKAPRRTARKHECSDVTRWQLVILIWK